MIGQPLHTNKHPHTLGHGGHTTPLKHCMYPMRIGSCPRCRVKYYVCKGTNDLSCMFSSRLCASMNVASKLRQSPDVVIYHKVELRKLPKFTTTVPSGMLCTLTQRPLERSYGGWRPPPQTQILNTVTRDVIYGPPQGGTSSHPGCRVKSTNDNSCKISSKIV